MKFIKMEGLGNDYIYIDGISQNVNLSKEVITKISDRHFGIGSDGVIVLENSDIYDFKMRMYNADGTEGKMCGNGIRCLAKFAYDLGYSKNTDLTFETLSGLRKVHLIIDNDKVIGASVDMGRPILETKDIPMNINNQFFINEKIIVNNEEYRGTSISMGNPHFVMFYNKMPKNIVEIGNKIGKSQYFPEGVNVEFVEIIDREHLNMRVCERGSGETWACGTGACASMYGAYLNDKINKKVNVHLKGGHLMIEVLDNGHILMTGPATNVYKGEFENE